MNYRFIEILMGLCSVGLICGCAHSAHQIGSPAPALAGGGMTVVQPDQMLVWRADFTIAVWLMNNAVPQAIAVVEQSARRTLASWCRERGPES